MRRAWRPSRRTLATASIMLLAQTLLGASCVDGETPDCTDRSVCAPSYDSGFEASDANVVPDALRDVVNDVVNDADAPNDADLDAGDEG